MVICGSRVHIHHIQIVISRRWTGAFRHDCFSGPHVGFGTLLYNAPLEKTVQHLFLMVICGSRFRIHHIQIAVSRQWKYSERFFVLGRLVGVGALLHNLPPRQTLQHVFLMVISGSPFHIHHIQIVISRQ